MIKVKLNKENKNTVIDEEKKMIHQIIKTNLKEVIKNKLAKDNKILKKTEELNKSYQMLAQVNKNLNEKLSTLLTLQNKNSESVKHLNKSLHNNNNNKITGPKQNNEHKIITNSLSSIIEKLKKINDISTKVNFLDYSFKENNQIKKDNPVIICENGGIPNT